MVIDTTPEQTLAHAEKIWLNYFNDTLLEKKAISETEWHKMKRLIREKKV